MSEENTDVITDDDGSNGGEKTTPTGKPHSPAAEPKPTKGEDLISKANAAAARTEAAAETLKIQLDRQVQMNVEQTLGGKTDAGEPAKKEDSDADYAKKVMANDIETTNP